MIPIRLHIKNFLSYGPVAQIIEFEPYALICLSGKNGHGKSALLDAMTWALWGQARKVAGSSKADAGLLHIGQTFMSVSFDFMCNNIHYRIRREYAHTYGKPHAALEFGIRSPDTDSVRPLTDKTIRATQALIEKTIHLDFDTFINSAFLRQGQSNEFSKKSAKDRKKILATILDLHRYETLKIAAQEKIKELQSDAKSLIFVQEATIQELKQTHVSPQELTQIQETSERYAQEEMVLCKQITDLEHTRANIRAQLTHGQSIEQDYIKTENLIKTELQNLQEIRYAWRQNHKAFCSKSYQVHEQDKQKLIATINEQQQFREQKLNLQHTYLKYVQDISAYEQKKQHIELHMNLAIKQTEKEILDLEKIVHETQHTIQRLGEQHKAINSSIAAHEKREPEIKQYQEEYFVKKTTLEKHKQQYHQYIAHGNSINQELKELAHKRSMVCDTTYPSCPLCEQHISVSRKKFIQQSFARSEQWLSHRMNRLQRIIPAIKQSLIQEHSSVEQIESILSHFRADEAVIQEKKEQIKQMEHQIEHLEQLSRQQNENLLMLNTQLANLQIQKNNISETDRIAILKHAAEALEKEIAAHPYNPGIHTDSVTRLEQLRAQPTVDYHTMNSDQEERKKTIHSICNQIRYLRTEQKQRHGILQNLEHVRLKEYELSLLYQDAVEKQLKLREQKMHLMQKQAQYEQLQKLYSQKEESLQNLKQQVCALEHRIDDYHAIALATSKDGIQALLIEEAIPEIEQEANNILSRLTDNQTHIHIESLKDLKKGGTKETLDINISDSIGTRPYELFSGGEAFRIDFALRIAISKLLARRSGTALQTLIIDEGFGSQDDEGLQHIMQAIYAIQEDFCKIIIVSHLPSMKEQFPVHFFVEKQAQGSIISVHEHD